MEDDYSLLPMMLSMRLLLVGVVQRRVGRSLERVKLADTAAVAAVGGGQHYC